MLRIRECEESLVGPILQKDIRCPVHLYNGEEAVAVGVCSNLEGTDYVFGNHRSHGHYLAKGGDMKAMVAEIYGKETGCAGGRGGSMHLIDTEAGFMGSTPIVAGTISLATGAALASKIRKDKSVAVSFFGDGATGEGVLYESLNFATLHNLPIIFVCENNFYSTHLHIKSIRSRDNIWEIAKSFKIKSYRIDGNDVLKVFETAKEAVDLCRRGKGPVFIEARTYRQRGHVGPDDNIQGTRTDIRPKEEIDQWLKKDPIKRFKKKLVAEGIKSVEMERIREKVEKEVMDAHYFARGSEYPSSKDIKKHVFK